MLPGGLGGKGLGLIVLAAVAIWLFSGFFRVDSEEVGVVLRFGKFVREVQPGLNYHLPYPIESVLTPKVTRINKIDIGMRVVRTCRGTTIRDVLEESLMLTGDENIVDVDRCCGCASPNVQRLSVQTPATRKARGEGGGRERARGIGRLMLQPILTGAQHRRRA